MSNTSRIILDLETASTLDLRKTGSHAYAEHPDTRVTVLCFQEQGTTQMYTWRWSDPVDQYVYLLQRWVNQGAVVVAHNYLFEFNIWRHKMEPLGFPPIPLTQWSCTMARSLVAGYPASLEAAARAARLDVQKDTSARDLMLRMARPRSTNPLTWWHATSPDHFNRLCAYCAQDVLAEAALDEAIPELSPREREVFEADHAINQAGINVDMDLVEKLTEHAANAKLLSEREITRATNGQITRPTQVQRIQTWLPGVGVQLPDLRRNTLREALQDPTLQGAARTVLQARLDASRSSTAKLDAIAAARSFDGRVKGRSHSSGGRRPGRAARRRLQPQNLFRGSVKDIETAVRTIKIGCDTEDLAMLYEDSPMGVVASCLRSCIMAPHGHLLCVVDFSQIEARTLAWLADEPYALDCFVRNDDIYTATAKAIGSPSRQLGKVLVLACGFGMGAERFRQTALTFDLHLSIEEAEDAVYAWRQLNKRIVDFWWQCNRAVMSIVETRPGSRIDVGRVTFVRHRDAVLIRLPSGRHLVYRRPHIVPNAKTDKREFCYMGSHGGDWVQLRSWPGKIVENITQAVARDVLVDKMVALHAQGIRLIAQVHDELVAEAPEADAPHIYNLMQQEMSSPVTWGPLLPLAAAGFVGRRYVKPA